MRTLKAFLLAPLWSLALMYLWTIAHFETQYALMALINPVVWLFALAIGLPALYVAEVAFALPIHYALERIGWNGRGPYAFCGAAAGAAACWMWAAIVRAGPLPLHRNVTGMVMVGVAAGAVGGIAFWRIAAGRSDRDDARRLPAKNLLVVVSPLLVLYSLIYVIAGHRYSWREWVALPIADPGGFGLLTAVAVLLSIALAIDQWKRRGSRPVTRA